MVRRVGGSTSPERRLVVGGMVAAGLAGAVGAIVGPLAFAALAVVSVGALTAWRPVVGTYLYLATLPVIAGIDRGTLLPLIRPNEAVLLVVSVGASFGAYLRWVGGRSKHVRLLPPDLPLVVFVVAATVWPIASLMLRGDVPLPSELAAVLPAVKLAGLLLLVRATVDTPTRLLRCIRLIFWTATAVAVVAILQTMRFGPVLALLQLWWAGDSSVDGLSTRGTTTLGHSIASGDVILIGMVLMVTARVRGLVGGGESLVTGLILAAGLLAAGQFSTWLAALVAGAYMLVRIPETRPRVLRAVPVAGLALAVGAPALLGRLQDIGGDFAVPQSWLVRWDNVSNLYVPVLVEGIHPLIGVSPDSVLPSPDTWRELIYIESGYLQFLWIGGIPLLLAFVWLSVAVLRWARTLAGRSDAVGAVVSTLEVVWVTVLVVSVLDPHVFLRGAGDLLFTLIGLATGRLAAQAATTDRLLGPGRTGQLPNPVGDDPTPVRHEGGR